METLEGKDQRGRKSIARLKASLKLPGHLLGQVRWVFLLSALVMAVLPIPMILSRNAVGRPLQVLAIAGLLWLCWWWIRGYNRANFPPHGYIPEGIVVCAAAVAVGNPLYAEGLVYTGLMFRSLFGTRRSVVAALLLYLGAFCGAVVISTSFANVDLPLATVLTQLPGLPLMAALLYVVATSIARYERATLREKIFRETGFKLVAASDRESIYQATFDAALKLVEDTPEARVGLATGSEEAMTVVASAGYRAAEIRGHSFNIRSLPPLLRNCLLEKQPVEVERPESSDVREALGLSSRIRPFFMAPLFIGHNLRGMIGVTSASALSKESKEGLVALTSQVSLALESNALAEEAHRRKSEERFRSLIQNASDIIMIVDADGSVSYISPAIERVLGYKPEDIVGTDSFVPVHPDDEIRVQNLIADVASKPGAASKFELRIQHADGSWRHLEASVTNLLHDPTVGGLVVNSRDVTERKQAEDTLRESEEKFRLLADNAQDVIFRATLQPTPRIEYISPSAKAMSGYEPEEFYADPHLGLGLVHPEDRQLLDEALRSVSGSPIALRWIRKDGGVIWAEQLNNPIYDEAGELVAIEGIARDITERKQAEKKLQKSEQRFRRVMEYAADALFVHDLEGRIVDVNQWAVESLGYTREELLAMSVPDFEINFDPAALANLWEEMLPGRPVTLDGVHRRKDGTTFPVEVRVGLFESEGRQLMLALVRDVTERKRAEELLQQQSAAMTASIDGMAILDKNGVYVYLNKAHAEVYGYDDPKELLGKTWHAFYGEEQLEWFGQYVMPTLGADGHWRGEAVGKKRDGSEFSQEVSITTIEGGGHVCVVRDITERKQAEKKLQESEANLAEAQQIARLGSWEHEPKNNRVYWSDETYRILGFTPQQFIPTFEDFLNAVHPDDRVLIQEDMANLLRGEQLRDGGIEYRIVRANGEVRLVQSQRGAELDETGGLIRMFGAIQDITERKRAEEQVRFQAHLLGQVQAAIIATDLRGTVTHWNEYAERLYGWPPEETLGRNIVEIMYGLTEAGRTEEIMEHLRTSGTSEGEHMLPRRDGSTFFAYVTNTVIHDAQGQATGIVGVSTDVTERKRAEEELRRRESELTEAQRTAHVGNWSFDITRNEGHWSDEMYRTFGFAPQEFPVTYKTFLNLVHPDDKDLVRKAVRAAFYEDRDWHSLDYRLVRPDGTVRFLHSQYKIVRDESNRSVKIVGTSQDVTEREQAEEELRRSEERFRRLVEQAADALFVHDLSGRFVEVNKQACESLGYTQEELLTMSVMDIEENFDPQGLEELWERVVSSGPVMIDGVNRRKDGTTFPVEIRLGLFEVGKERLMLAVARDVTERKRAEDAIRESEERYRAVVQQSAEGMFLVDLSTKRILDANSAYQTLLGYDAEEMCGLTLYDVFAHDRESIDFHVQRIADEGDYRIGERQHRRKDGSLVEVEVTASLISYGGRSALSVVAYDVTERKQAEEELRKSEARNRAILEATPDLMFRVSRDGEYLDFRAKHDSKLFIPREEIVGKTLRETMPPDLAGPMLHQVAKTLDTGEMQTFDYQLPVADGMLDFEARLVVSGPGEVLSIVRDVTERKALERRLEHQAFHDALTGLPNRALFLDRLEHALSRSGRRQESITVLFIDLDNFKVINDSLGHDAGDELLIAVAVRLQECLRTEDTLARLGGDEFTILIEDLGGATQATNVAERVAQALQKPFVLRGQEVFVTASVGIALDDLVQNEPGGFLRSADLAMYRAKANGKNRYEVFDVGMNERALQRMRLENELRRALERNELRVYYQPKLQLVELNVGLQRSVESANGRSVDVPVTLLNPRIVGMEALVRWEHPELGLVAPPQFIPIAEETGLIVPMGRWVLREACRQARQWQEFYPSDPPLTMSVNLSAREFQQPDLAQAVVEILDETGLSPSSLDLEITESLLMEDTERTVGTLQALKDLGVQLSIDDFGTGYSSLSYLDRFPVDNLKIDKTFVEKLGKSHKDTALVSTTITLSHDFGLKAIAEGLETADQLRQLRDLRCDQVQGYYFSKPLPRQEMSAMLTAGLESKVGGLLE